MFHGKNDTNKSRLNESNGLNTFTRGQMKKVADFFFCGCFNVSQDWRMLIAPKMSHQQHSRSIRGLENNCQFFVPKQLPHSPYDREGPQVFNLVGARRNQTHSSEYNFYVRVILLVVVVVDGTAVGLSLLILYVRPFRSHHGTCLVNVADADEEDPENRETRDSNVGYALRSPTTLEDSSDVYKQGRNCLSSDQLLTQLVSHVSSVCLSMPTRPTFH